MIEGRNPDSSTDDRIDGWTIQLYDAGGNLVVATVTGPEPGSGIPAWYESTDFVPGDYVVAEVVWQG